MLKRKHISLMILCAYVAAVALMCFMKTDNTLPAGFDIFGIPSDKAVHFIMFFPFPIIAHSAFLPSGKGLLRDLAISAVVFLTGSGFAAGTERLQSMLEYRSGDIMDFAADMAGMACGSIITIIHMYRKHLK